MKVLIIGEGNHISETVSRALNKVCSTIDYLPSFDQVLERHNEFNYDVMIVKSKAALLERSKVLHELKKHYETRTSIYLLLSKEDRANLDVFIDFQFDGVIFNSESYMSIMRKLTFLKHASNRYQKLSLVQTYIDLMDRRDIETADHLKRVAYYSKVLAEGLREHEKYKKLITSSFIDDIFWASHLHDVGKLVIKDQVLFSSETFTEVEYAIMKNHTLQGAQILKSQYKTRRHSRFLKISISIAKYHHEYFNGTGYPEQLKGTRIPLPARIVALADVFDALTSKRTYKDAFTFEEAKDIIINQSGTHFDPEIVEVFKEQEHRFIHICDEMDESIYQIR